VESAAKLALEIRKDRRQHAQEVAEQVLEVIQQYVAPESWQKDEATVGAKVVGESLVIRQPRAIQREVEKVIEALYAASGVGDGFGGSGSLGGGGFF
jgi:hypothetical protein